MKLRDGGWHDRMYNNRELVPDHQEYLGRWSREADKARAVGPCELDIPYGDAPG